VVSTGFLIRGDVVKTSLKVALSGIICALSVSIMLLTIIPTLEISLPVLAGILLTVIVLEIGVKWGITAYAVVGILSLLIAPSVESKLLFVGFFGYYPILKCYIERLRFAGWRWVIKLAVFNIAIVAVYVFLLKVTTAIQTDDFTLFGVYLPMVLLLVGNGIFVLYDIALSRLISAYVYIWQFRLHKMFRF
jgi:hypothetical protein